MWEPPDVVNLSSGRIALGPLREDLAPVYNRWRNDFWAQRTYGNPIYPVSLEVTLENTQNQARSTDAYTFTIYRRDIWQPIGKTNLQNIQFDQGTAEFGIGILEPSFRGQGYGTEATRLMLFYGFRLLGLHAIQLTVDGANPGGQRAYEKAGFKLAGRYREAVLVDAKHYDLIHMDILASEFTDPDDIVWGMPEEEL
jgi:RimJ/RimL family protein N-acetyltransferase